MISARTMTMMNATECSLIKANASHDLLLGTGHPVGVLRATPNETEAHDGEVRIEVDTVIDRTAGALGEGATGTVAGTGIMKTNDEDVTAVTTIDMGKDDVGKRSGFFFFFFFEFPKATVWRILSLRHFICRTNFSSSIHRPCYLSHF